jgi:MFS transporter, DHA2 family, multidrug resistance protein
MLGTFMQVLDQTIANVALPYMQGSLAASRDQITWVLTSYIIASAIMTAPVGWLASRFGRRNLFIVSLAGFTLTSMACGAAQSLEQMIVFRLAQGIFGAALSPLSQATMLDAYPIEKRGQIMALWGMVVMVAPILGPTLGGFLTDNYGWRWVFYVNVPVGIIATTGVAIFLKQEKQEDIHGFDFAGFLFLSLALGGLQLVLDRGTSQDWFDSMEVTIEAIVAGLGVYLFLVHYWTARRTFIPHGLFKDRNYVSALTLTFFVGVLMLATSALLPPYLQTLEGYSVFETGMLLAPRGIATMLTMFVVGRLAMKMDIRVMMGTGAIILLWSMWEMKSWTPDVSDSVLAATLFAQGVGMGLIFIPSNIMAFGTLPAPLRTDGSALINLTRNVGSAIGVSVSSTVLAQQFQSMHASLATHVTPFNRALSQNAASMMWNPQLPFGLTFLDGIIARNAQVVAYSDAFLLMFYLSIPALIVIFLMRRPQTALVSAPVEMEAVEI